MTNANKYDDRMTQAVYAVLIEIGQVLGAYTDRFVVIGGSVPWLLYPQADPQHIGTIDVDLSLDANALGDGDYASLVELLERAGYQRGQADMRVFQMRRTVTVDDGAPIVVVVDLLMPRESKITKNRPPLLADFAVLKADGAGVAMENFVRQKLAGNMPDGRYNSVELRVASIPAFLVMKGYALTGRDKAKDAYDVYYSIKQFEGGALELAAACRGLLIDPVAAEGYRRIGGKFADFNGYGPQTVKRFLLESSVMDGMTPEQIQQDAYMQVRSWYEALGMTASS
ncbi:nucleotidyl transferase AbiEii/AbiGii toxin family protein [Polaromonas eurypsychrophila]|uniref:Nucleotidyl transferase AbiEii toxin, Type IV TA system n=1 Tax=Polaromonas eurypsychrophila TaxID=1614635 RepID=A0A916SI82_9BURK|nr:nucleotidyl transferase AbiEii/AbiGii toxin family protein [Polaromonas eurypsychrophila]GGB02103.1 hypothetical protein GCM10011496_23800 [Polaromonas eurypsychrophila]